MRTIYKKLALGFVTGTIQDGEVRNARVCDNVAWVGGDRQGIPYVDRIALRFTTGAIQLCYSDTGSMDSPASTRSRSSSSA